MNRRGPAGVSPASVEPVNNLEVSASPRAAGCRYSTLGPVRRKQASEHRHMLPDTMQPSPPQQECGAKCVCVCLK